jgi:hypothetical protein
VPTDGRQVLTRLSLLILLVGSLSACAPIPLAGPGNATPVLPTLSPTLTSGHDVADLLRDPPPPGKSVEVDAYFNGAGDFPFSGGPPPAPDTVACPFRWFPTLTDRPLRSFLSILNATTEGWTSQD